MEPKRIVIVVNDFGFGPLSRAFSIARKIVDIDPYMIITMVTSGKTDYLLGDPRFELRTINDLRSVREIERLLQSFCRERICERSNLSQTGLESAL